ncbi:unnamed protein product [Coffea canephora]|uniref:Uncharacterized protein n=1 Tax=Coffea canephora TaxID=49390 RepID=A0A068UQC4_COFCA|nr:unnamed protein product [Coffea canephora]
MGGGNKKKFNGKSKSRKPHRNFSSSARGQALFVEGGVLADWSSSFNSSPSREKNLNGGNGVSGSSKRSSNGKGRKGLNSGSGSVSGSGSRSESSKTRGHAIGYVYPSLDAQEGSFANGYEERESKLKNSCPIVLVDSEDTPIVAYIDEGPSKHIQCSEYNYDYTMGFTLDESSHRGLGFHNEAEETTAGIGMSANAEEKEDFYDSSASKEELNVDDENVSGDVEDEFLAETLSTGENSGFLSIGGLKIYTRDISDDENDESDGSEEEGLLDEESLESSESEDTTETSDSEESSDSSDIDDEVAADYFEGIGGSENIVDVDQLVGRNRRSSPDNGLLIDRLDDTLEKFGGIALQEASREYGMMKPQSSKRSLVKDSKISAGKSAWSSALDDIMAVKDPRTISGRKKHYAKFPKSWPFEAQKSRKFWNSPGEKKKHRKEMIAIKRRERMLGRGVDLQQINLKLQRMVLDGVEILSFQPMHSRDCSQVQRLASIYRLRSASQGSGKKRFVTVTRTQHTCMPSSSDTVRLEKLIGTNDKDLDFTVYDMDSVKRDRKTPKKTSKGAKSTLDKLQSEGNKKKRSGKRASFAAQPVSFVSSGIMDSDMVEHSAIETSETSDNCEEKKHASSSIKYGAFELHTRGFGSKMMARMGYVEGCGLGKDGQGMAEPIEVLQRPKSLGLGAEIAETSDKLAKKECRPTVSGLSSELPGTRNKLGKKESAQFASFERHTKGFGSKVMAKMGFVEGMGLGKDSQGMIRPLVVARRPKSRGLGATG